MEIRNFTDIPQSPCELVELLAIVHLGIAANSVSTIANSRDDVYDGSLSAFRAMIKIAYPEVDSEIVYEIWLNSYESIAFCVNYAKTAPEYNVKD